MTEVSHDRQVSSERTAETISPFKYEGEYRPYVERIQELMTLPEADRKEIQADIDDRVSKVQALLTNPLQQHAVESVGGIGKWVTAGTPEDPLPRGLVAINPGRYGRFAICFDERIPHFEQARYLAESIGVHDALEHYQEFMTEKKDEMRAVMIEYAQHSAAHRFLKTFTQPSEQSGDAPLSPYWRQVRENDIEQDIRRRHGMADGETFMQGTSTRRELARRTFQLDDEVMSGKETTAHDGLRRFETFCTDMIKDELEARHKMSIMTMNVTTTQGTQGVSYVDQQGGQRYVRFGDLLDPCGRKLSAHAGVETQNPLRSLDTNVLRYAFINILTPSRRAEYSSLDQLIDMSAEQATDEQNYMYHDVFTSLKQRCALRMELFQPTYDEGPYDEYEIYQWRPMVLDVEYQFPMHEIAEGSQRFSVSSWESQAKNRQQMFGEIAWNSPETHSPSQRLIMNVGDLPEDFPQDAVDFDLHLSVNKEFMDRQYITHQLIPGYKLVAAEGGARERTDYYYVRDPEGDPYVSCDVAIAPEMINKLRHEYWRIGLDASTLGDDDKDLTIAGLVEWLAATSDYMYENNMPGRTGQMTYADTLTDFRNVIRNGRLKVQCSGAAAFLKVSLESIYGKKCARSVSGYTIGSGDSRVNGVRHAQVIFAHDEGTYILDSTPVSSDSRDLNNYGDIEEDPANEAIRENTLVLRERRQRTWGKWLKRETRVGRHRAKPTVGRHRAKPAEQTVPHVPQTPPHAPRTLGTPITQQSSSPEIEMKPVELPEVNVDEKISELIDNLKTTLRIIHDVKNDELLYERLSKLPAHDPMRRTLKSLMSSKAGNVAEYSPHATLEYLQKALGADVQTRRRFGIEHYTDATLEQLAAYAEEYIRLRR